MATPEKKFSKLLLWMAKRSPLAFAETIRTRNLALLDRLEKLRPWIGHPISDLRWPLFLAITENVDYGCPHCFGICGGTTDSVNTKCLWVKAQGEFTSPSLDSPGQTDAETWSCWGPCCDAVFPSGYNYKYVAKQTSVGVGYGKAFAYIRLAADSAVLISQEDFDHAHAFLQDHVDWASLPSWGTECDPVQPSACPASTP